MAARERCGGNGGGRFGEIGECHEKRKHRLLHSCVEQEMMKIDPREIPTAKLHSYLLSAVAPRPIAFASTVDEKGTPNLAPFSFFNAYSSNPPTLVFSANRRVKDNTTKDTYANIKATREVV